MRRPDATRSIRRIWGSIRLGVTRFVAAPYTYEVLEGVSHWIPEEVPEMLDALLGRHFDSLLAHGM